MVYKKYNIANNASGQLNAGISAVTETIVLKSGEGASFPATNFIGTLVQYTTPLDPTSGVAKREKVLCSVRSSDTLTVTRGFGGDTPATFNADDYFYQNVVAEIFEDMQDELTRIETDKLDISDYETDNTAEETRRTYSGDTITGDDDYQITVSEVVAYTDFQQFKARIDVANTDGATFEVNSLGAKTIKKLTGGTYSVLTTGDIVATQTAILTYDIDLDIFILENPATSIVADATDTIKGISRFATIAEALAGTSETTMMTPKNTRTYSFFTETIDFSLTTHDSSGNNTVVNHNLGVIPKSISAINTISGTRAGGSGFWSIDGGGRAQSNNDGLAGGFNTGIGMQDSSVLTITNITTTTFQVNSPGTGSGTNTAYFSVLVSG